MRPQRITRHMLGMELAELFARRSTCMRLNVGAVIMTRDSKLVLAHGYNGPPAGEEHCTGRECATPSEGCQRARHAEINAIQRISPFDISKAAIMYVTDSPCPDCFRRILAMTTIVAIFYRTAYRKSDHLTGTPLPLYRITPSGYIIDHRTGELVDENISV